MLSVRPVPTSFSILLGFAVLLLFYPFIGMLDSIMPGAIYLEDVTRQEAVAYIADSGELNGEPTDDQIAKAKKSIVDRNIPLHLSLFHTLFNLTNICMLIGFTPHLGRLVERIVQPKVEGGTPKPGSLASFITKAQAYFRRPENSTSPWLRLRSTARRRSTVICLKDLWRYSRAPMRIKEN